MPPMMQMAKAIEMVVMARIFSIENGRCIAQNSLEF